MAKELNFEKATKRKVGGQSLGLPVLAEKCEDEEIYLLLRKMWEAQIRFYLDTSCCVNGGAFTLRNYEIEESSFKSRIFGYELHPQVEGYLWYRGIAVKIKNGMVLIFSGWMQPWLEEGSPYPIVYTRGGLGREDVLPVIKVYCEGILAYISQARLELAKNPVMFPQIPA